jgi:phosphoenolpyruvate synthase/pyruvate phosphate dikinase
MRKTAVGTLVVLPDYDRAARYLESAPSPAPGILVTREIDWSWTRIMEHFAGVITDRGTRVSRAAELITIMGKPGVLGTEEATQILPAGTHARIICEGNRAAVYLLSRPV